MLYKDYYSCQERQQLTYFRRCARMPQVAKEFNTLIDAKRYLAKLPGFCRGVIHHNNNLYQVLFDSQQPDPDDQRNKYEKRIDSLMQTKLYNKLREA